MSKKKTDTDKPSTPKPTPAQVKRWSEMQREMDRKIRDLEYEDRNGYQPPKPWYEE